MANRWEVQNLTVQDEITELYVATLGRAPDKGGLAYWVNQVDTGAMTIAQVAASFFEQPETQAKYPTGTTNNAFVIAVYMNALDRAPDTAGLQYWTDQLDQGLVTRPDFILAVLQGAYDDPTATPPTFDSSLLTNQHIAAEYFAGVGNPNALDYPWNGTAAEQANFLANAHAVMVPVTADASTILISKGLTDAFDAGGGVDAGQTFVLTESVDHIVGTPGNDTIIAGEGSVGGVHTLGSSDVIDGGEGTDRINIRLTTDTGGNPPGPQTVIPNMSNVEQIHAQSLGDNTKANGIDLINTTGVQEIWSDNSTASLTVTNLQAKATIGVSKGGDLPHDFTVQITPAAVTGALDIVLDSAQVTDLYIDSLGNGTAPAVGFETVNVNAEAGISVVEDLQSGDDDIKTLNVSGDGRVTITDPLNAGLTKIDASANNGGTNLNVSNSTVAVDYTGGTGDDRINFGATLGLTDKVDGGAGHNTLAVDSQAQVISGLNVTNIQVLELAHLDNAVVDASRIPGVNEVQVTETLGDGYIWQAGRQAASEIDGLSSGNKVVVADTGALLVNVKNATVAGTNDTFNLDVSHNANVDFQLPGVETVNLNNVTKDGSSAIMFRDADGIVDLRTLNVSSATGSTTTLARLNNTIKTVDAHGALGDVNVSITTGNATNGVSITGGAGNDSLNGGDGKDIIVGGAGNDVISGDAYIVIPGTHTTPIQQSETWTPANVEVGDTFTVSINGNDYNYTATTTSAADVATGLAAAIGNAGGAISSAAVVGNGLELTGLADGTAFCADSATTNKPAAPEVSTVTIDNSAVYDNGDVVSVVINGGAFSYTVTADGTTADQVAAGLLPIINGSGLMTATDAGNVLTLTGESVSTDYTVTANVANGGANTPATASVLTITPGGLDTFETLNVIVDGQLYSTTRQPPFSSLAATLTKFVATHGAALSAQEGGAVVASTGTAITITNAAGTGLNFTTLDSGSGISGGNGGTLTPSYSAGNPAYNITANPNPTVVDGAPIPAGVDDQTLTETAFTQGQAVDDQYVSVGTPSADSLTGGSGKDLFVELSSNGWDNTSFTTMDTITDLNFGGANTQTGVDTLDLSRSNFNAAEFVPGTGHALVNAGTPLSMTGPNLGVAVQALFNTGGALDGATNRVGLFTYGSDTYLIAADNMVGFNPNDVIIKVTGVQGTLDLSDIHIV